MSVQKKGGKIEGAAAMPPPPEKTIVDKPKVPERLPRGDDVEELSGSLLVEEEAPVRLSPTQAPRPEPPRKHDTTTQPSGQGPLQVDSEASGASPPHPPSSPLPEAGAEVGAEVGVGLPSSPPSQSAPRRSALPIIGLAGLIAAVGLVMIVVAAVRRHESSVRTLSGPIPGASSAVAPAAAPAERPSDLPSTAALTVCTVAGEPRVIAPSAIVAAGVEVRAFGSDVALGFAPNDHQAMLVRLDPSSLSTTESTVSRSAPAIRRVTPIPGGKGKLDLAIDVDRNGDPLQGRRTLPIDPPVQVGVADAQLAWAPLNRGIEGRLWRLDGEDPVEALRGARSESNLAMVAIAFRRAGAVWVGTAERATTLAPKGELSRVGGLGPMVGSPAIAINEGVAIAAWADRPAPEDPWHLRWIRFKAGEAPGEPNTFKPPPGGRGQEAMSPALAVVPGASFLLVWTEGPTSAHAVRALTLSADGVPTGRAMAISGEGVNAGQGQAAVASGGRGVVAFLESNAKGFQVAATPIVCSQ